MRPESPSEHRKRVLEPYIRARLERDLAEKGRGFKAELARAIVVSRPHASNIVDGKAGIGEDLIPRFAKMWSVSIDQLDDLARQWAKSHADEDASPAARLLRLVQAEAQAHPELTAQQIAGAMSLAAYQGKFGREDVRRLLFRTETVARDGDLDSELAAEHSGSRGRRKRRE